jgi:heme ABC exporter ATP-binding subunit CcmA
MPSPEAAAVACAALERRFGARTALAGVDLAVQAGELVLLTGPNGAGKTTLLRILATVLRPGGGRVAVAGHELPKAAPAARRVVGYAGHDPLAYPDLTARENLDLFAALHGAPAGRVAEELDRVGLAGRGGDRVAEFSRGMLQRLALARVSLHAPAIVLLDEPTAGLDDEARAALRDFLHRPGRTVIAATHEPEWFAGLGGRVVRLAAGRVAA